MGKFLTILLALAFLYIAGAVQADWVSDVTIPQGVNYLKVHFDKSSKNGDVVIKTRKGDCTEYKVVNSEIVRVRKCADPDWTNFMKEDIKK
jgi:hypothetical protein